METKFNIKAEPNSPIWGNAKDMKEWLENWHADGCPVMGQISLPQSQPPIEIPQPESTVALVVHEAVLITPIVNMGLPDAPKRSHRDVLIIGLHQAGRSNEEIAEQVGVPVGTVSKVVVRSYLTTKREALQKRVAKRVQ